MFDMNAMMQMFGQGGGGQALGQGLQMGAGQMAPGMGAQGLQPGASPPVVPGMGAQGIQGMLPQATPETLDRLASAPIDPTKIMQMLQQGQQQPHAQGSSPAAGRGVGQMQQLQAMQMPQRGGLADYLGG